MRKNKVENIDEDMLIREILSKRNIVVFFLLDDKVSDIYERNLDSLLNDDDNIFLNAMINYLSETKMLTHDMRQRGYDIVSLLFFNKDFRTKERVELINKIKGLLNLMPIVDDYVFYKNEYDMFYDVTKLDYSEALKFNHETLLSLENQVNDIIYSLSCLSDKEYYDEYEFENGSLYCVNYILNNCKEVFKIEAFRKRSFEMLALVKYHLKEHKKEIEDFKDKYTANKKIIKKAKKI